MTTSWKGSLKPGIYERINEYLLKDIYPFHMPGHKRNPDFFPKNMIEYDLTELPGMDNLHYPEGVIRETEQRIADIYGAKRSHILVNGSTCGITASIMSHTDENKNLLLSRNSHKSAYNGLIISGAVPRYARPENSMGVPSGVTPDAIRAAMEKDNEIYCVLVTSPTYEGMTSDIKSIAEIVHKREGAVLIVDEAHGAHFAFHRAFPVSAVRQGADIVINSLHKTLPILGQCSVIHICSNRVDERMLEHALRVVQTSSPSYMFMSMIDKVLNELYESRLFDGYVEMLTHYRSELRRGKYLELRQTDDISKLWFTVSNAGMTGSDLMRFFREHGVELEMYGPHHVLALTSVADKRFGFEKLLKCSEILDEKLKNLSIDAGANVCSIDSFNEDYFMHDDILYAFSPREVFYYGKEEVALDECLGRVAAQFITPYPPGIPMIVPGELITSRHLELINDYKKYGLAIEGTERQILVAARAGKINVPQ